MGTYTYNQKRFGFSVTFIGIFCIALCLAAIAAFFNMFNLPKGIAAVMLVVAGYQVWNTFIAIANPRQVVVDEKSLAFSAYGRTDSFALDSIHSFSVREFPGKRYVRINNGGLFHGRYWVQTGFMNNGEALEAWLAEFEYQVNPNTVKAQARRSSQQYAANKQQINQILERDKRNKRQKLSKSTTKEKEC